MNTVCFVIATNDRPHDMRRMLQNVAAQSRLHDRVVIIDSSAEPAQPGVDQFRAPLYLQYLRHLQPSPRPSGNAGIAAVPPDRLDRLPR